MLHYAPRYRGSTPTTARTSSGPEEGTLARPFAVGEGAWVALAIVVVVIVVGSLQDTDDDGRSSPYPSASGGSSTVEAYAPEDDLATIQLGHRPDADDSTLLRITYLLDRMQEECPANTRRQLADFTANVMRQLEAVGVAATPKEILTDVRESSSLQEFDDCLDLFALYTILRKEQG